VLFANVELVRLVRVRDGTMKPCRTVLLAWTFSAALSGCGGQKENQAAAQADARPEGAGSSPARQALGQAAEDPAEEASVSAPLIVEHQVDVTAQREGIVAKISADTGTRVSTGTLLAQLDDRQLTANLEAARAKTRSIAADLKNWQAEAEVLKADYVRAQRLFSEKLIAEEQLQHAKYKAESDQWDILRVKEQLNTAREEEQALVLELEKTQVMAPFPGLVARRYVRQGQSVARGERLFWVTAEGPLRVRFTLPEKYIGRLRKGLELPLSIPALPAERHKVKILQLSPVVDPASGTIEVMAELSGRPGELRPGMTVEVHLANLP
jgi:membrane fusion protein (multidrug efflux system)